MKERPIIEHQEQPQSLGCTVYNQSDNDEHVGVCAIS